MEAAKLERAAWLASLPRSKFSFGEVRHDPPWHIQLGIWSGGNDIPRGEISENQGLCGKFLGRRLKRWPHADDDICYLCVVAATELLTLSGVVALPLPDDARSVGPAEPADKPDLLTHTDQPTAQLATAGAAGSHDPDGCPHCVHRVRINL
jgi:hypothetical protein